MSVVRLILVAFRVVMALGWTLLVHYFCIAIPGLVTRRKRYLNPLRWWGKGLSAIMGIRVHRVNSPPSSMGDLIVSNHMGFLDIPVLLQFFPAVFVIKMELGKVPFFGARLIAQGHVFVERGNRTSRANARQGIETVLQDGDRIIVFPEGRACPYADRPTWAPASLQVAQRLGKQVQLCIIDYLPNRELLKWDISKPALPQLANLLGRRRIDVSIQFFSPEHVTDPIQTATDFKSLVETQLNRNQPE